MFVSVSCVNVSLSLSAVLVLMYFYVHICACVCLRVGVCVVCPMCVARFTRRDVSRVGWRLVCHVSCVVTRARVYIVAFVLRVVYLASTVVVCVFDALDGGRWVVIFARRVLCVCLCMCLFLCLCMPFFMLVCMCIMAL